MNCLLTRVLLACVRFYRKHLSRLKGRPTCKYVPCCSLYACQALERYGAVKGGAMAAWRVLRCNPFSKGGYDPVPQDPLISFNPRRS